MTAAAKRKVKTQDQLDHIGTIELYAEIDQLIKALARVGRESQRVNMELAINGGGAERLEVLILQQDALRNEIATRRAKLNEISK